MFSKKFRIVKKEDFNKIYKLSYKHNLSNFRVFILRNNLDYNRYAVVVSKKISPSAVKRNIIKRKIRHVLSSNEITLPSNVDILIIVNNKDILKTKSAILKDELLTLTKKLKK